MCVVRNFCFTEMQKSKPRRWWTKMYAISSIVGNQSPWPVWLTISDKKLSETASGYTCRTTGDECHELTCSTQEQETYRLMKTSKRLYKTSQQINFRIFKRNPIPNLLPKYFHCSASKSYIYIYRRVRELKTNVDYSLLLINVYILSIFGNSAITSRVPLYQLRILEFIAEKVG